MQIKLEDYYRESRRSLEKSTKVIIDPAIFDFNYVPRRVFIRKEIKIIMDSIVKFDGLKAPFNLFIYGSRGSGKTVLLKFLMNFLKGKIKAPMVYINCRLNNTSFKIISGVLKKNGRGLGTHELYGELTKAYTRLVVVLDEIDLLRIGRKTATYCITLAEVKGNIWSFF